MIIDVDRHVAVDNYAPVLEHMENSWKKHFERTEFLGSIVESSNHIRVSSRFGDKPQTSEPLAEADVTILLPHQPLTINGWADAVAATVFAGAFNGYARETWSSEKAKPAIVVSPVDVEWSAAEIRRRAAEGGYGAIALPLGATMLGSKLYDPIWEAAIETGLTVIVHYSGVEGLYAGAASLGGGIHRSAFSRMALIPQLAESNITSLAFEGVYEKYPDLQILFSGFGIAWLPALLWRIDREWRTFRYDVPWVKRVPSTYVLAQTWVSTWPLAEATMDEDWGRHFKTDALRSRVVFGSHGPFDGDTPGDVIAQLGEDDGRLVLANGGVLLPQAQAAIV